MNGKQTPAGVTAERGIEVRKVDVVDPKRLRRVAEILCDILDNNQPNPSKKAGTP